MRVQHDRFRTNTNDPNRDYMFDRGRTTSAGARTVQEFLTNSVRGRTTTFRKGFKKRGRGRKRAEPMILLSVIALQISDH